MKRFLLVMFILIPLIISATIFLTPDRKLSENENKSLKTRGEISISSFQEDVEAYLGDQLFCRDFVVSAKSKALYLLGKRDINGCYICKDRFIQKITDSDVDYKASEKYADKINNIAKNVDTYVLLVPSACITQSTYLPNNAPAYNYDALLDIYKSRLSNAKIIDIKDKLSFDGAYYLTDHHWTSDGAYCAYRELCKAIGTQPKEYEFETATTSFKGTLYSKALINKKLCDTIKTPVINDEITVVADGQSIELYDKSALEEKDAYKVFEGGNHGILTIENKSADNEDVLLILKDSFANSFVPYLISDYKKIIMLDERYAFDTPGDIIEKEGVTQILILKEIIS